jgi:hypothetical protein
MPNDDQPNSDNKTFEFVAQELRIEIGLFWQRSIFFWGFIAAAFVAYGVLVKEPDKEIALAISCFGLVCSIAWTLMNRGSKYWQVAWEAKLNSVEGGALGRSVYSNIEPNTDQGFWGAWRYSVTRLTIALSDFTVLVWLALGLKASPFGQGTPWKCIPIVMIAATFVYILAIFIGARSRVPSHLK